MTILLSLLLAAACLWVLALPFRQRRQQGPDTQPDPVQELRVQRQRIYDEIRTLGLERDLGTIGEEEYQSRLRSARLRAATNLRDQEQLEEQLQRLSEQLEAEVQEVRTSRRRRGA
ncbi:MAG: hypothetical protein HYY00_08850 [Chloroflexi bacterium]|nr:hypothetical protein [Chloroflexota bacterium]